MCALFTGNNLIELQEVDSTNNYVSALALKQRLPDGTVVIAAHQTAGKGQRGAVWQTDKNKNLTFSILYYPGSIKVDKQFYLTEAISLGVSDFLKGKCEQVKIKWPNDIYVGNRKIGGLLIENSLKGEDIAQVIVGIGLNIKQEFFNLPENKATSLQLEKNGTYDLKELFNSLLSCIEKRYMQWLQGNYKLLHTDYISELYLFQSWHIYKLPDGRYLDGKITGVKESGHLLIEDSDAQIHQFGNKEIIF